MKKDTKKILLLALTILFTFSVFLTGCGAPAAVETSPSPSESATASAEASVAASTAPENALKKTTLKLYLFGAEKTETKAVFQKISEEYANELNCDFEVTFIPGSDYTTKLLAEAASGSDWDLNFDGDWLAYSQMVNNGAYLDVLPLINEYAPDLAAKYSESGALAAVTAGGKAYALPWTMSMNQRPIICWNKELADKANLTFKSDSIKTIEDYDALNTALHAAYPDKKIAEIVDSRIFFAKNELAEMNFHFVYSLTGAQPKLEYFANTEAYTELAKWASKWQTDGIIWKDVLTDSHDGNVLKAAGDMLTTTSWHEWANASDNWGTVIGGPVGSGNNENRYTSTIYPDNKFANRTPLSNLVAINANAKNPERAMMFMNLVEKDQKFYDLLQYGIEGVTYVLGSNGEANYPEGIKADNSNYMEWGGQWAFWKPQFMRPNQTYSKDFWVREAQFAALPSSINAPLSAFFLDPKAVQNELTLVAGIWDEYNKVLSTGLVKDYEASLTEMRTKLKDAGIDKVTTEFQKQVDAYIATK